MENPSFLLVLTGKTASGKDTVMMELLKRIPEAKRVITTTSRSPRPGEIDGKDYYFILKDEFKKKIDQGDFWEYVQYGGNWYGTEKKQLENNHGLLIWRIDPSMAGKVKKQLDKPTTVIYITVDDETVINRLKQRGFSDQEIKLRMEEDTKFWQEFKESYDFVVENVPGKLDQTIDKVMTILQNKQPDCL